MENVLFANVPTCEIFVTLGIIKSFASSILLAAKGVVVGNPPGMESALLSFGVSLYPRTLMVTMDMLIAVVDICREWYAYSEISELVLPKVMRNIPSLVSEL